MALLISGIVGALISGSTSLMQDVLPDWNSKKRWLILVIFLAVADAISAAGFVRAGLPTYQ